MPDTSFSPCPSFRASPWLTVKEAAAYLGCSKTFLDHDRLSGLYGIPFVRLGRMIRYNTADLDAYLQARTSSLDSSDLG